MTKDKQKSQEPQRTKKRSNSVNQFLLKRPGGMNKVMFKYLAKYLSSDLKNNKAEFFNEKD